MSSLRAIHHVNWSSPNDANELTSVARRKQIPLMLSPSAWAPPILWGHTQSGPFTIIEGNHRLTALAGSSTPNNFAISVCVGLSRAPCWLHQPDCQ
ncbi:MAG: hypothetical protein AB4050_14225 [Synechococcus sp.]